MARIKASLLSAQVMHSRLTPKKNRFRYGVYYVALPLDAIEDGSIASFIPLNRFGLQSFYVADHGYRNGGSLMQWIEDVCSQQAISSPTNVTLVCMPRVLGYVFNPVSFWLCYNQEDTLYAVVCEVHNTFGEAHSYVCVALDNAPISSTTWIEGVKKFHVSPFLPREGYYSFQFQFSAQQCTVCIDYLDQQHNTVLVTLLAGRFYPLTKSILRSYFIKRPLVTLKAIALIHVQALKLFAKGVAYHRKPPQLSQQVTRAEASRSALSPKESSLR